jgi:hypothetical protein
MPPFSFVDDYEVSKHLYDPYIRHDFRVPPGNLRSSRKAHLYFRNPLIVSLGIKLWTHVSLRNHYSILSARAAEELGITCKLGSGHLVYHNNGRESIIFGIEKTIEVRIARQFAKLLAVVPLDNASLAPAIRRVERQEGTPAHVDFTTDTTICVGPVLSDFLLCFDSDSLYSFPKNVKL